MSSLLHLNPAAQVWAWPGAAHKSDEEPSVTPVAFHKTLSDYGRTPLHSLPSLAKVLGLGHVLLKDESNRFGLPSFKILGASWAVYRAVAEKLGIGRIEHQNPTDETSPVTPSLQSLGRQAKATGLRLITATEGNWGRAVARMGKYLENMPVTIFVPGFMPESTRQKIRDEGAEIMIVNGNYDDAVAAARSKEMASGGKGVLAMDFGWEGYERIPEV
jgi:diaminopropionate ammonia-lyase